MTCPGSAQQRCTDCAHPGLLFSFTTKHLNKFKHVQFPLSSFYPELIRRALRRCFQILGSFPDIFLSISTVSDSAAVREHAPDRSHPSKRFEIRFWSNVGLIAVRLPRVLKSSIQLKLQTRGSVSSRLAKIDEDSSDTAESLLNGFLSIRMEYKNSPTVGPSHSTPGRACLVVWNVLEASMRCWPRPSQFPTDLPIFRPVVARRRRRSQVSASHGQVASSSFGFCEFCFVCFELVSRHAPVCYFFVFPPWWPLLVVRGGVPRGKVRRVGQQHSRPGPPCSSLTGRVLWVPPPASLCQVRLFKTCAPFSPLAPPCQSLASEGRASCLLQRPLCWLFPVAAPRVCLFVFLYPPFATVVRGHIFNTPLPFHF